MSREAWTKHSTWWNGSYSVPIVAEADLLALLERHVELFNQAVLSNDYRAFLATFAIHCVMSFDDLPFGPYRGLLEIAEAYENAPPNDTIALIDMEKIGGDAVKASFEWDAGGTGEMYLRWEDDLLVEMRIAYSV
jgi:steroid delta-isomerase